MTQNNWEIVFSMEKLPESLEFVAQKIGGVLLLESLISDIWTLAF